MKILSKQLKYAAASLAVLLLLAACGCNAAELSSLRSFAKPYVGAYECTEARFGGRDLLQDFPSVVLTLEPGGTCVLEAVSSKGKKHVAKGNYVYREGDNILFTATVRGRKYSKSVSLQRKLLVLLSPFRYRRIVTSTALLQPAVEVTIVLYLFFFIIFLSATSQSTPQYSPTSS